MSKLDELIERRNEALAGRGETLTNLERAVAYYESEEAAAELEALQAPPLDCPMCETRRRIRAAQKLIDEAPECGEYHDKILANLVNDLSTAQSSFQDMCEE